MAAAHVFDVIPNVRVVERRNGGLHQFLLRGFYLFLGWGRHTRVFLRLRKNHIFVKSVQQLFRHAARRCTYFCFKLLSLRSRHLTVQANDTVCKGSQRVFVLCPQRHIQHQFFHADSRLALQGSCVGFLGFRYPYGIYNNKMVFILGCRRRNFSKIFLAEDASATSFHLLKVVLAPHIAHENQTFNGLHVSSRCNHIHGDGNAGIVVIAERTEDRLRVIRRIGDFTTEVVALTKFLAHNLHNIVCMAVGFGKNQRLGNFFSAREQRSKEVLFERADNCANLAGIDNIPVKLRRCIVYIFVHLPPALGSG